MVFRRAWLITTAAAVFCMSFELPAAPNAEQRQEIEAITGLMVKAGTLFKENKFNDAGEAVKEAQTRLAKVAEGADQATVAQLAGIYQRVEVAHALLKGKGIELPALEPMMAAKPVAKSKTKV